MLLEPVVIECPWCHTLSSHYDMVSFFAARSACYSDGKTTHFDHLGMPVDPPGIYQCRNCQHIYWHADSVQEANHDENDDNYLPLTYEETHPGIEGYQKGLQRDWPEEKELELRIHLWWAINDLIREGNLYSAPCWKKWFSQAYCMARRKKILFDKRAFQAYRGLFDRNLEKLKTLLADRNGYALFSCEVHRELGEFEQASRYLLKAKAEEDKNKVMLNKMANLIKEKDKLVKKL